MNVRLVTQEEVAERQQSLRATYLRTQCGFSISGIRRLMGNSFIAAGEKILGRSEERRVVLTKASPLKPARGI